MKNLYMISGTMGVGKTATCWALRGRLERCVFLDGDWCWNMSPLQVTEETKRMVEENICFVLNNFIRCSAYQNIVFCWVMHRQEIIDSLLNKLDTSGCAVHSVSLVCSEQALRARLQKDVAAGIRQESIVGRSAQYLPLYEMLNTKKLDVTDITAVQAAERICQTCGV